MRAKPRNISETLQHWVDRCEACHSEAIAITGYELIPPKKMGFWEKVGNNLTEGAARQREDDQLLRQLRRKSEGEVWVEYHCKNCGGRFEKSAFGPTFEAFLRSKGLL